MNTRMSTKDDHIEISHDDSIFQISVQMPAGKDTWTELYNILDRFFGKGTARLLVIRMLDAMSIIITSDNGCGVTSRIPIDLENDHYIDIGITKNKLVIVTDRVPD
jgi:hypothetical protein